VQSELSYATVKLIKLFHLFVGGKIPAARIFQASANGDALVIGQFIDPCAPGLISRATSANSSRSSAGQD